MKKKVVKKSNFMIKELCLKNTKSSNPLCNEVISNNISAYSMNGTGFNGKEISWKQKTRS